ncbi:MAG: Ig-like domain-containing protein [Nibricoccus sp.]
MTFNTLNNKHNARTSLGLLSFLWMLAFTPLFGADTPAAADADTIVSTKPMEFETEDGNANGQLFAAQELTGGQANADLVFTITEEPQHGRVGMAGGDSDDFFTNKTSHLGYFVYQSEDNYEGTDSFAYTVRNETTGLIFKNKVVITLKLPPPLVLDKMQVSTTRDRLMKVSEVMLTTRPNWPVSQKLPSHEDFMTAEARESITNAKVSYVLDDKAKPQNGTAKLDRATGQLTYAPNPGFVGEDKFGYYTFDENHQQFGVDNTVRIKVEPIRHPKHVVADRSKSREVDLVFVINNSPSMAAHQDRIAANLSRFRQLFRERDLDYRIGVLTTDFVNADLSRGANDQEYFKEVRSTQLDKAGNPVLDRKGKPKQITKKVASNGTLVTLPALDQPWVTPKTPDSIFAELVKVGTNGDSNRTAFTSVYNFVAGYYNKQHAFLRPEATTIVVFFMDEEETRMATWKDTKDGKQQAEWVEDGKLPDLIKQYNARNPQKRITLDGYIEQWVLKPFIIVKGNKRGKLEMHAVVGPNNVSHRRAAELTNGTVLNIEGDFSGALAALGDRIAETVAVALDPVPPGSTLYKKSLRVLVDGQEVAADPQNGYIYDDRTNSVRFQGEAKKKAFAAKIDITYEEHM